MQGFGFGDHEGEHFFEILKVCTLDLLSGRPVHANKVAAEN